MADLSNDDDLALLNLLSAGAEPMAIRSELELSSYSFNKKVKLLRKRLSIRIGLEGEPLDAILAPRPHGKAPTAKYFPRYSGPAVTIEKARVLDGFHDAVVATSEVQDDWNAHGLHELARWLSGWRPADHDSDKRQCQAILDQMDVDLLLYVRPEGLRFEQWIGSMSAIELAIYPRHSEPEGLFGILLSDARDPESSIVTDKGARIGLPLRPCDQLRWKDFKIFTSLDRSKKVHLRLTSSKTDALTFEKL